MPATLRIGDATVDRIVDIERFDMPLTALFPDADGAVIDAQRHWLEPRFMAGDTIALSIHSLLLRIDGRIILVDTCVGEHKPRPRHPLWHNRKASTYLAQLAAHGVQPHDIDMVFCTHLHADHVGWNTVLADGRWVPTFPRARYLVGRTELAHWQDAIARDASVNHGSWTDSVLPIVEAGLIHHIEAGDDICAGCTVRALPGHTSGQIGLALRCNRSSALVTGDAIHHPVQLAQPGLSSSLCSDKTLAAQTRAVFLDECAENGSWLLPAHFLPARIMRQGDAYRLLE